MSKISVASFLLVMPALFVAEAAFANFVCTTSGGDSRTFTARGRTQAEAQAEAFKTCDGAGHTGSRSCQVNMVCDEEGRGPGHGPGPGWGGGGPGWGRPGWGRPSFYECVTSGGDSRQFFGRGRTRYEAEQQAYNTCDSAGRTGHRSCRRNMSCYVR